MRIFLVLIILEPVFSSLRVKREPEQLPGGFEAPASLRSIITCWTPIGQYLCLGPRVEVLRPTRIAQSKRYGLFSGYHNGVDIPMLKPYNIPMIEDETEIGTHIGATFDAQPEDGVVEWGQRGQVFKAWKQNVGGVVEWDRDGVGADVGMRASAADEAVNLNILKFDYFGATIFAVDVGRGNRKLIKPGAVGHARLSELKPATTVASFYPGYYTNRERDDWYREAFKRPGDEYRTAQQRGCPWCAAFPD